MAATIAMFSRGPCQLGLSLCRHYVNQFTHPVIYRVAKSKFPTLVQIASLRTNTPVSVALPRARPQQEVLPDVSQETQITEEVISKVNNQLSTNSHGRLFAVVHICGKQFKVTDDDIIVIEGYWPPTIGDQLRLEKVLVIGGSDFTLFGRPVLSRELVQVEATVIEKSLSLVKTHFRKKRRKQYMRINFHRSSLTMLRINSVSVSGRLNQSREAEELAERIF